MDTDKGKIATENTEYTEKNKDFNSVLSVTSVAGIKKSVLICEICGYKVLIIIKC